MTIQSLLDHLDRDGIEVFRTPDGEAYAAFTLAGQRSCCPLMHRDFRTYLYDLALRKLGEAPGPHLLTVRELYAARARSAPTHLVLPRVSAFQRAHFLDLCDGSHVVRISAAGWEVIDANASPAHFRRSRGMLPLPLPELGGHLEELRPLLNLLTEDDWILVRAWLLSTLRPVGPYPILVLQGEHGSAKSTTALFLRSLVDPNQAPLRDQPKDARDLLIAATHGWIIGADNLSRIPGWFSDALCRLSTGGGLSTRALYTDGEESIFFAQRPVILNGIEELCTRSDLLDRALVVHLPALPADRRKSEEEMCRRFTAARGRILGALLDAAVGAWRRVDGMQIQAVPRMADFALWSTAAEEGLGLADGAFLRAYESNRQATNDLSLEGSPIAEGICRLVEDKGEWTGTATELLAAIRGFVEEGVQRQPDFPRTGRAMSGQLRRVQPNLRAIGIEVVLGLRGPGHGRARLIRLLQKERAAQPSQSSGTVRPGPA